MIAEKIKRLIDAAAKEIGIEAPDAFLEHPEVFSHGDYSSNIALAHAKALGKSPRTIAEDLKNEIEKNLIPEIEKVEVAGAGFLNFYLSREFFSDSIKEISNDENFGKGEMLAGRLALFEYTDANPFKAFHIGHLMSNAIGESLSRLASFQGADVKRLCYGGDVGLHVAKTIWGMQKARVAFPEDGDDLTDKIKFLGDAYVAGSAAYEDDADSQAEIKVINKKVFEKSNPEIQIYYDKGRKWAIQHFEEIYQKLHTKFDKLIFESEVSDLGLEIVNNNIGNIFEKSEGAIIFKGEDHGLHTRVFISSQGLPLYEAKDLGLFFLKAKEFPSHDLSIVVTASEQNDYFRVLHRVFAMLDPKLASKFMHVCHGLLRFASGKMSSRKGNIITGESLIEDVKDVALSKINKDNINESEKPKIAEAVAIAAIKYSILRQSPGKDIIFDEEKSLSFEGDSGPYLQYALVRSLSLLEKAKGKFVSDFGDVRCPQDEPVFEIEKLLYRFPEIAARAWAEKAPQLVIEYLTHLASSFNGFYASGQIVSDADDSPYKVAITKAFSNVMKQGLSLLAIPVLAKM
ncbi:MAG: arginine--tRNA ligase [Patescibacteria group bacterium]